MQRLASGLNKSKRQSYFSVAIADWVHRDCLTGDSLQQEIFVWLSPPDPWKNHHTACESSYPGTAAWFIQGYTFSEWKRSEARSSLLWVHGKRPLIPSSYASSETYIFRFIAGAGKSVLWYGQTFDIPVSETYRIGQLYNHRRRRCHAESWARIISDFLL